MIYGYSPRDSELRTLNGHTPIGHIMAEECDNQGDNRGDNQEKEQEAIVEALEVAGVSHLLPKFIAEKVKSNARYFGVFNIEATHQCFTILMLVLSTD